MYYVRQKYCVPWRLHLHILELPTTLFAGETMYENRINYRIYSSRTSRRTYDIYQMRKCVIIAFCVRCIFEKSEKNLSTRIYTSWRVQSYVVLTFLCLLQITILVSILVVFVQTNNAVILLTVFEIITRFVILENCSLVKRVRVVCLSSLRSSQSQLFSRQTTQVNDDGWVFIIKLYCLLSLKILLNICWQSSLHLHVVSLHFALFLIGTFKIQRI